MVPGRPLVLLKGSSIPNTGRGLEEGGGVSQAPRAYGALDVGFPGLDDGVETQRPEVTRRREAPQGG